MYSQRGAAQYQSVRSHGLVEDASPSRLVQIMFEQILAHLATAQGCMDRIKNMPLPEVVARARPWAGNPIDQSAGQLSRYGAGPKIAEAYVRCICTCWRD